MSATDFPELNVALFGAGAVGSTIAAWVAPHLPGFCVVDVPKTVEAINARGITAYLGGARTDAKAVPVRAYPSLKDAPKPDVVLVCVKNYSLDAVAKVIHEQVGDAVTVVGFQNGVDNQQILPRYFKHVIYGIVAYNAWLDEPGLVGFQKHGPLVLGTLEKSSAPLNDSLHHVARLLGRGVPIELTDRLNDAAHCKMVINLTNSLTTLVGFGFKPITDPNLFQRLLTNLTAEGAEILRAAGFHEVKMGGMPSWAILRTAARLPGWLTRPIYKKNLRKMVVSSMAQDILQRRSTDSELESLNGRILSLADQHSVAAPYNRAVYSLCRERFGKPGFQPMDVKDVWAAVAAKL